MNEITWTNKTVIHPLGVCEGATSKWLFTIGAEGIQKANQLKAVDCDELQKLVESGQFTWSTDLKEKWAEYVKDKAYLEFEPFEEQTSSVLKEMGKSDMNWSELNRLLSRLSEGDFGYISASLEHGDGHALAIYRSQDKIYFFDPNNAIYEALTQEVDTLSKKIIENVKKWSNVVIKWGKIKKK
ncbi:MAG: hypothetical protein ICV63_08070 [Coleofasciculus sp. Co-bin14]|nr:hypothetical protein [Coleofasciculus sp. Co-bin14]